MPQQIVLLQWVRNMLNFKPFALIGNLNCKPFGCFCRTNVDLLVSVVSISVYHGIHHALPESHADTMLFILVKTRLPGSFEDRFFRLIDAFQRGGIVLVDERLCAYVHLIQVRVAVLRPQ